MTPEEIVTGYYEHWLDGSDDKFWAFDAVSELCHDLTKGTDITLRLIASAEDDAYLAYVAAGPVEDLIKKFGKAAVALFEAAAQASPRVIDALAGVWIKPSHEGYSEWYRVLQTYSESKH
jgi:hypothetical protein